MTGPDLPPQIRQRTVAKAHTLIEALPFMREHRGKVIVIKYGGAAMVDAVVRDLKARGVTVLMATHQLERVGRMADQSFTLEAGRVVRP